MRTGTTHLVTGGGAATFGTLGGAVADNAALVAALALKLDKAGGTMTGALAITAGALNTAALSGSQMWDDVGTVCRGIEHAVTDTNSADGSTLLRLLGGAAAATEKFLVTKDARVCAEVGGSFPQFTGLGYTGTGMRVSSTRVELWVGGSARLYMQDSSLYLGNVALTPKGAGHILQLGVDAAGVSHQTLTAASRITSNGVGANLTIAPGNGRGAAGGSLILATYPAAGSGVAGTRTTRITLDSAGLLTFADAVDMAFDTSTGTKIGTSASQKLGFYGATPVAQHSSAGNSDATIGMNSGVTTDTTFQGSLGGTAYTIGDIIVALKTCGIMAM